MKDLSVYLNEALMEGKSCPGCGTFKKENEEEENERLKAIHMGCENEEEEKEKATDSIKNEKDFKEYAENKFKVVFGDNLDKDKMNKTIEGLLSDNKELVDKGDWGELIGMLNKSFGA
jgi:hypothetical protein